MNDFLWQTKCNLIVLAENMSRMALRLFAGQPAVATTFIADFGNI